MTREEHKKLLESLRRQKKTEQIGFRCTKEMRRYIDNLSNTLEASISDTITYMLSFCIMSESYEHPKTLHVHMSPFADWVKSQAEKEGLTISNYLESLIKREHDEKTKEEDSND